MFTLHEWNETGTECMEEWNEKVMEWEKKGIIIPLLRSFVIFFGRNGIKMKNEKNSRQFFGSLKKSPKNNSQKKVLKKNYR